MNELSVEAQVDQIVETVGKNFPDSDLSMIRKAYELADKAHADQKRRSGEKYIIHPVAVAYILSTYHMDAETFVAALLHDVVEDTIYTKEDITEMFNADIAYLVEGVTKIGNIPNQSKEESQAENVRKMMLASSKDIRIIMIKLVDRLHNMRTLEYMNASKQVEKSTESLEIYAPIANRLGIQSIKAELEDLALKYLEPEVYNDLARKIELKKQGREEFINRVIDIIKKLLGEAGIQAEVYGRSKHLYSIYRKMKRQGRDFDEIYDLFAIRILTDNITECYSALGVIHTHWNPIPGRFKDYIATPKANNYQSIHTTVIGPNGDPFEIQIRTHDMHETAEYGIAAHWKYKEGRGETHGREKRYEAKMTWMRQMLEWQPDFDNANDFLETMKVDLLEDEVYVFTPKGKIVQLPAGSCPIDFAYRIHSDIGNSCVGAKVNGKIVPLNYILQTGDIILIRTSKNSHGPSRDWLSFTKSAHSRNKIRQYFKREEKEENIAKGRIILENEIKKAGLAGTDLLSESSLAEISSLLKYKTISDLYAALGYSGIKTGIVMQKMQTVFPDAFPKQEQKLVLSEAKSKKNSVSSVFVGGQGEIDVHFAKCCSPVPGDKIVGYITIGKGISVHRSDCPNINHIKDPSRLVQVEWNKNKIDESFLAEISIKSFEKQGGLLEISKPFYDLNVPIITLNTRTTDNFDYYTAKCEVKSVRELNLLIKEIKKIPEVLTVTRS